MDRTPFYEKVIHSLKVTSKRVSKKSLANCRILDLRQPTVPNGDLCKYHICVEIAHKQLNESYSRDFFIKIAGTSAAVYQETFGIVCAILQVTFDVGLEEMAEKLGVTQCLELAGYIIEHFKIRYESQIVKERRVEIKHNNTALYCCGLLLAAETYNMDIDVLKMLQLTSLAPHLFETQLKQVRELTIKLVFPSGSAQSSATESETLGNAPATKKHKGAVGAIAKGKKVVIDAPEKPPKITLDTPIDKDLEEKIKQEDEKFVAKLMKVSMLVTAATSTETKSQAEKIKEDDERYRKWRESVITASATSQLVPIAAPKKQTTINFAKATPSSSSS